MTIEKTTLLQKILFSKNTVRGLNNIKIQERPLWPKAFCSCNYYIGVFYKIFNAAQYCEINFFSFTFCSTYDSS